MSIYCAREFSALDIETIRRLMEQNPKLKRAPLSRKLCELFGWTKPNGELKDMTCRVALLRMQADGLITLAPSQMRSAKGKPHFPPTPATDPQASVLQPVHELDPLTLRPVTGSAQPCAHLQAVDAGQHHVEHHGVVSRLPRQPQGLLAVTGDVDGEALRLQAAPHRVGQTRVIVYDQHPHAVTVPQAC